jgi:hypothetical protein
MLGGIFYWMNDCQLLQKKFPAWFWLPGHVLGWHTAADISPNIAQFCEDQNVIWCETEKCRVAVKCRYPVIRRPAAC